MFRVNKIKEKGIPRFLLKSFLFLSVLFILDFYAGSILKYLYYKQNSGWLYRTSYSIDSTKAEILIFGSSTANHHYYPEAFERRMNMTSYNAGKDGNSIFYHYSILQGILKRYSPKIAILDFSIGEFKKNQESYDRISSLLPYYHNHPEIRPVIQLKSPYEKFKLLSKIYPYNSLIYTIAIRNPALKKRRKKNNEEGGYLPIDKIWNKGIGADTAIVNYQLDDNKINLFRKFIRDCTNSNVKLYVVISPRLIMYKFDDTSITLAKEICDEFNIPFYDFSSAPLFMSEPELFADKIHLNDRGAKIFSNKVIDKIINNAP